MRGGQRQKEQQKSKRNCLLAHDGVSLASVGNAVGKEQGRLTHELVIGRCWEQSINEGLGDSTVHILLGGRRTKDGIELVLLDTTTTATGIALVEDHIGAGMGPQYLGGVGVLGRIRTDGGRGGCRCSGGTTSSSSLVLVVLERNTLERRCRSTTSLVLDSWHNLNGIDLARIVAGIPHRAGNGTDAQIHRQQRSLLAVGCGAGAILLFGTAATAASTGCCHGRSRSRQRPASCRSHDAGAGVGRALGGRQYLLADA